ncbi:MAG: HAD-IA family hydrolase [Lentisphaerae bacterium]|nr:HAD-IA family hydrolase [Lentisphaerota bacterium]
MLVMLDLDGTLIDSSADICNAVNLARKSHGVPAHPFEFLVKHIGDGVYSLIRKTFRDKDIDLAETVERYRKFYAEHMVDETVLFPDVLTGLQAMRQAGYKLAIISNKEETPIRRLLKHFEIEEYFDVILGANSIPNPKPHPDPIFTVIEKTGCKPESAWMVGDHFIDLETARRAGVKSIFVTYGIGTIENEHPTKTFSSFKDVYRFLLNEK